MTELKSGFICRIINQELNLAWDLSREDKTSVVGAQPNESFTQRWKIEHIDGYWTIENVSNEKFANVESVDPIRPGVKVVTANQRNWEFRFDHEFDGWRIIFPDTNLNAEIAILGPPLPEVPIILGEEVPVKNQVWRLEED